MNHSRGYVVVVAAAFFVPAALALAFGIRQDATPNASSGSATGFTSDLNRLDENPRLRGLSSELAHFDYKRQLGPEDQEAREALWVLLLGNQAYREGSTGWALDLWSKVIREWPDTPARYMAILNTGAVLKMAGRHSDAIAVLTKLLDDEAAYASRSVSGFDMTELEKYLICMNNDCHDASCMISECHEQLGDISKARDFAVLSRDRYPFRALCSLGFYIVQDSLNERISSLEKRLNDANP